MTKKPILVLLGKQMIEIGCSSHKSEFGLNIFSSYLFSNIDLCVYI